GRKYFRRVEVNDVNFYYLHGPILVFAPKEAILREALELEQTAADKDEPPLVREFRLLGINKPLAALWVNPRAFDSEVQRKAAQAKGPHAAALQTLLRAWQSLRGIAFSVILEQDLELAISVRARLSDLPSGVRRFFQTASEPANLWQHVPDDA